MKIKLNLKQYLGECLLIVFSVLFALFINKAFEEYKTNREEAIARESIKRELIQNQVILNKWQEKHLAITDRISNALENKEDSLKAELKKYDYLNLMILTNYESIIDEMPTKTAWESAKTTGIISEFDYETIQKLTRVYNLQEILTERTIMKVMDYYYDTESHNLKNLDKILVQFYLRFWELTGQEVSMINSYKAAINELED